MLRWGFADLGGIVSLSHKISPTPYLYGLAFLALTREEKDRTLPTKPTYKI